MAAVATRLADAAAMARTAWPMWAATDPQRRGRLLYGIAEAMERRGPQLVAELAETSHSHDDDHGVDAHAIVKATIDRWFWYAGWADKIDRLFGATNTIGDSYIGCSTPRPRGVIGVLAPPTPPLLGLCSMLAPPIVTGNTVVAVVDHCCSDMVTTLAEMFSSAGLPPGVVNVIPGVISDSAHQMVQITSIDAIDLSAITPPERCGTLTLEAAEQDIWVLGSPGRPTDWFADPGTDRMADTVDTRMMWYPRGF